MPEHLPVADHQRLRRLVADRGDRFDGCDSARSCCTTTSRVGTWGWACTKASYRRFTSMEMEQVALCLKSTVGVPACTSARASRTAGVSPAGWDTAGVVWATGGTASPAARAASRASRSCAYVANDCAPVWRATRAP